MRLLCATDLSSRSDRAFRRAGLLARAAGAELVLLSVVDDDQPARLVASERREVTMLLGELSRAVHELEGLQPRLRVEVGDAFDAIIRVADAEEADLVVMGEHRKRLLRDVFVGTTIGRRHAPRPPAGADGERTVGTALSPCPCGGGPVGAGRACASHRPSSRFPCSRRSHRVPRLRASTWAGSHDAGGRVRRGDSGAGPGDGGRATRGARRLSAGHRSRYGVAPPATGSRGRSASPGAACHRGAVLARPGGGRDTWPRGAHTLLLGSVAEEALHTLDCDVLAVPPTP